MSFQILQVEKKHLEILSTLGITTYKQHFGHIWTLAGIEAYILPQFQIVALEKDLQIPKIEYFIAFSDETPLGFIKLKQNQLRPSSIDAYGLELEKIYILNEFVGKGFGQKMLDFVFERARKQNIKHIWLDVVKSNVGATKLYEKNHFEIVGEIPFQTDLQKPDMWIMKREDNILPLKELFT